MELTQIYHCFCDATRLRIIHLLTKGPLCVCHFQGILEIPQTKVSQHLAYLRKRGMVETRRHGQWIIYSLPEKRSVELENNLKCLQDCALSDKRFLADLKKMNAVRGECEWIGTAIKQKSTCC